VILRRDKTDSIPNRMSPTSPADAVDVVLRMHWEVIIDDVRDAIHVDTPSGDVRRYQNAHGAGFKILQSPQPLVL